MSRKVDPDDEKFIGEILWPHVREPDTLAGSRVVRADVDSRKGGAIRNGRPYRPGLQEESDASSLPHHSPYWKGTDGSNSTKSPTSAHQSYDDSRVGAVAGAGIAAETAAADLEIGHGGTVSSLMHESTGTNSRLLPVSLSSAPYDPRVGAHAVQGFDNETAEPGDDGTIVIGDETVVTESPEAVVAEAFTQDTWKSELRDQLRSEIQAETQAQIRSQIVAAESVGSDEGAKPPFWTRRRRMYLASSIVMVIITGVVVGVLFATGTIGDEGDCLPDPTAVQKFEGQQIGDAFGFFVVLSSDGSTMAVGARDGNYVQAFRWNKTKWDQIGQTIYGPGDGKFGCSVALNQDGLVLAVGEYNNDNEYGEQAGIAQVFQYNDSEWYQIGEFKGDNIDDRFGWYVSLSSDGRTVAIGAKQTDRESYGGYVRVFNYSGSPNQWFQLGRDLVGENAEDQFGRSVALAADGGRLAVGARHGAGGKGRVQVLDYFGGNWTQVGQNLDGDAFDDWWGSSIDLSANGSIVAIGADGANGTNSDWDLAGLVRVYTLNETGLWAQIGQSLLGEGPEDHLGNNQIALSDNGDCLAVGSVFHNNRGKGYLFQWNNSHWNEVASVTGECPEDRLGEAATVSGNCSWYAFGSPNSQRGNVLTYRMG